MTKKEDGKGTGEVEVAQAAAPEVVAAKLPEEVKVAQAAEVKIIERIIESKEIAPVDVFSKLTKGQVDLMKRTIAKGSTDDELAFFLQVCASAKLNPFLRQVYFVKRWDSKEGKEVGAIQIGIDGFRGIAEEGGSYAGSDDAIFGPEITHLGMKAPEWATVTVHKVVQGQCYPFTATARWTEYVQTYKPKGEQTYKPNGMWSRMPHNQLAKCAEALALRKAFPKLLSGFYVPEEMDQAGTEISESQAQAKRFEKLMAVIGKSTEPELIAYREKISKSDKYSEGQKAQFFAAVDDAIDKLKAIVQATQ